MRNKKVEKPRPTQVRVRVDNKFIEVLLKAIRLIGALFGFGQIYVGITLLIYPPQNTYTLSFTLSLIFLIVFGLLLAFPWRAIKKATTALYVFYIFLLLGIYFIFTSLLALQVFTAFIVTVNIWLFYGHYKSLLNPKNKALPISRKLIGGYILICAFLVLYSFLLFAFKQKAKTNPPVDTQPIWHKLSSVHSDKQFKAVSISGHLLSIQYYDPKFREDERKYIANNDQSEFILLAKTLCEDKELRNKYKYSQLKLQVSSVPADGKFYIGENRRYEARVDCKQKFFGPPE